VFERIHHDFAGLVGGAALHAIPITRARRRQRHRSERTSPWFDGPSLLPYLETVEIDGATVNSPFSAPHPAGPPADARFSRLRGTDRVRAHPRRRHHHGLAFRTHDQSRAHRDLDGRSRRGVRADVGNGSCSKTSST
jgi:hypothetical protein